MWAVSPPQTQDQSELGQHIKNYGKLMTYDKDLDTTLNQLTRSQLEYLAGKAIAAAETAGGIIAEYTGKKLDIRGKEGGTSLASQIFTEVDLLSENAILAVLKPTIAEFDLGLLAEETAHDNSRLEKEYFWCIDPLDGTLPFTEGVPGYSVSIALVSKTGIPCIGVIFDPVTKTLYHAVKGYGVFKNNQPWSVQPSADKFTFVCDRSFLKSCHYDKTISSLTAFAQDSGYTDISYMTQGGAAMNACWVIENAPAYYLKYPKKEQGGGSIWDYAATACIFTEIGAHVSDIYGTPLPLNNPNTTFMNQCGILYSSEKKFAEEIIKKLSSRS